jgi:Neprosin
LYREDLGGPIGGMTLLGWWPGSLFKYLSNHAEIIQWAGIVTYSINKLSPPMGSGHFSSELKWKATSFTDCFGFDEYGYIYEDDYEALTYGDKLECYDVSKWHETKHSAQHHFFYGGPSGCT